VSVLLMIWTLGACSACFGDFAGMALAGGMVGAGLRWGTWAGAEGACELRWWVVFRVGSSFAGVWSVCQQRWGAGLRVAGAHRACAACVGDVSLVREAGWVSWA
jgi:hypothetical protein